MTPKEGVGEQGGKVIVGAHRERILTRIARAMPSEEDRDSVSSDSREKDGSKRALRRAARKLRRVSRSRLVLFLLKAVKYSQTAVLGQEHRDVLDSVCGKPFCPCRKVSGNRQAI